MMALPDGQTDRPAVAVIILNWNGWRDTVECIASLDDTNYPSLEIVVVDNGSHDDSVARIGAVCPHVTLIPSTRNRGFAGGNNLGIDYALKRGADYVWLLNNDAVVAPNAPRELVALAEAHPDCVFFGSWIVFASAPDRLWFGGGGYDWRSGSFHHKHYDERIDTCPGRHQVTPTDWISGCSMFVRAEEISRIGLLDDRYFLYREELEWQLRRNPRHPTALLLAEPLVQHKVGRSTGGSDSYLGTLFMSRNYLLLTGSYARGAAPLWLGHWLIAFVLKPVGKRQWTMLRAAIRSAKLTRTSGEEILRLLARPEG